MEIKMHRYSLAAQLLLEKFYAFENKYNNSVKMQNDNLLSVDNILIFLFAMILSLFMNVIIQKLHYAPLQYYFKKKNNIHESRANNEDLKHYIDLFINNQCHIFGSLIGFIERAIYIYSIIIEEYSLISGWLVLKAFFGWISSSAIAKQNKDDLNVLPSFLTTSEIRIISYYLYIYGNGLSLLAAIFIAKLSLHISNTTIWN